MSFKKTIVCLMGVGLGSVALVANAGTLTISNYTNQDSTTKTNGSTRCSSDILGSYGVTPKKKPNGQPGVNNISDPLLRIACAGHLEDCRAVVYMDNRCATTPVASVTFSVTKGLIPGSVVISNPAYQLGGSGFNLQILGGQ